MKSKQMICIEINSFRKHLANLKLFSSFFTEKYDYGIVTTWCDVRSSGAFYVKVSLANDDLISKNCSQKIFLLLQKIHRIVHSVIGISQNTIQ